MNKIRRRSKVIKSLLIITCLSIPAYQMLQWFVFDWVFIQVHFKLLPSTLLSAFSLSSFEWNHFYAECTRSIFYILAMLYLIKLFKLYEDKNIYTKNCIDYFRNISICLFCCQVLDLFIDIFTNRLSTLSGKKLSQTSFFYDDFLFLMIAFLALVVSWIMKEKLKVLDLIQQQKDQDKQLSIELTPTVGIAEHSLSMLKTGRAKTIRLSTLEAICKELKCQPGDIFQYGLYEKHKVRSFKNTKDKTLLSRKLR